MIGFSGFSKFKKSPAALVILSVTSVVLFAILLIRLSSPVIFKALLSYIWHLLIMTYNDSQRVHNVDFLTIVQEYKLHEMEMTFNQEICRHSTLSNQKTTWLTAMMNDDYAIGAVFLGYVLRRLSCHHNMIALVSDSVSKRSIEAMRKVGYDVRVVEKLDCNWMDRRKGIPERNKGLPGTHMRFHAWNFTEFDSIIYLDPDLIPLNNLDELFSLKGEFAASYCARPGIIDPCFNAGLLMFKPSKKSYDGLMSMWENFADQGQCPNDQVLLWHYYADHGNWLPLPYAYNVRRYLYHPMKVYHFACCITKKPWRYDKPDRDVAVSFKGPFKHPQDMIALWWKYFYEVLDIYELHDWFEEVTKSRHMH